MAVAVAEKTDLELFSDFCDELRVEDGSPMGLQPFQRVMLEAYFNGCMETLILLPKKNGKTSLIGALVLFHLLITVDAEVVVGASSKDQATILFNQAWGLIRRSPALHDSFNVKPGTKEIRTRVDEGRIRVLSSDAATSDGVIPTLAIVDELHRHKNGDLYGVFRDGLAPRNGKIITISTAGADEESALGQLRTKAYKLPHVERTGAYRIARSEDYNFVMHEWALNATEDLDDIALVKEANPASWQTLEVLRARHDSPSTQTWQWARFACGVWVKGYEQWLPRHIVEARAWNLGGVLNAADEDGKIPQGSDVIITFDGSFNGDSTAIVACTLPREEIDDEGEVVQIPPHLEVVEVWEKPERAGEDWIVPVEDVEAVLRRVCRYWRVRELACDTYRWQRTFEILMKERLPVVEFPQRPSRTIPATTRLYEAFTNGGVTHDGDPRLMRHIDNAVLKVGETGGYITKVNKSSAAHIDLAVCAVMAFDRAFAYKPRNYTTVVDEDDLTPLDPFAPDVPTVPLLPKGPQDLLLDATDADEIDGAIHGMHARVLYDAAGYPQEVDGFFVIRVIKQGDPIAVAEVVRARGARVPAALPSLLTTARRS